MNEKFNDDNPKINIIDVSFTNQEHYFNFNALDFLSRDNNDTEEFIIPDGFIPTKNSGDISFEV